MRHADVCRTWALRAWLGGLLDGVARRCIRISRRDPRESARGRAVAVRPARRPAGDARAAGGRVELVVQTPQWYQNLMLRPRRAGRPLRPAGRARRWPRCSGPGRDGGARRRSAALLVTAAAGRLPGLMAALEERLRPAGPGARATPSGRATSARGCSLDDGITRDGARPGRRRRWRGRRPRAGGRVHRGDLPAGHRDAAPLLAAPHVRPRRRPAALPRPGPPAARPVVHAGPRPGVRPGLRKRAVPDRLGPALRDRAATGAATSCATAAATARWSTTARVGAARRRCTPATGSAWARRPGAALPRPGPPTRGR